MDNIKNITITEENTKTYDIVFDTDYTPLPDMVKELAPKADKILIVSDSNVAKIYLDEVKALFDLKVYTFVFNAGEANKNEETLKEIINALYEAKFSRSDVILSLGGGVVSDMTGFAASIYMRGIKHVICPTTLLSMADASVGAKTAIDYNGKKNLIGAFYNPSLIYMNLSTLKSLPSREYYAGFAEIMKAGLIKDDKYYMWLIDNMYEICEKDPETVAKMLYTAINIKKAVVEKDLYETTGERMLLNLGHTIGHGIESVLNDEYIHGECVSLGCVAAAYISSKLNYIDSDVYYEIRDMFVPFYLPISIETDKIDEIINAVYYDKKNALGKIRMVLLNRIGDAFVYDDVSEELVREALDELNFKEEG
ncbi:MAG: 3-dehydroquinate synthase [Lachnospiraceae bacterium]|nr:3-dehydroquinate synthase [Lachnospiraceae bacterium]